ncbi:MAG: DUF1080 domain-containing protein [Planctomycetes bacterium]|nr:DUF1080 domain-containing protein [Planctomycetota bacterium]
MLSLVVVATGLSNALHAEGDGKEGGFRPLFDGETLEGWEGSEKWFRVQEGAIVGGSLKERIPRNEFLCTKESFGDFELRLKAKLIGEEGRNAGVQFRTQRIPDHHEVIGYQCDMGAMNGRPIWGSLYDESRRRKFLAHGDEAEVKRVFRPEDWNEFVVRAEGPRIQIWLNGVQTVDYTEEDAKVAREGIIAVQIHGGPPSEAWYKDIRIKSLGKDGAVKPE